MCVCVCVCVCACVRVCVCVQDRGRISRLGLTQDFRFGSCVFQCDVPHQWIAQQVGLPLYCDEMGYNVLCLRHGIPVWQHNWSKYHCYKQAPSRYDLRYLKTTLNQTKRHRAYLLADQYPKTFYEWFYNSDLTV